MKARTRPRNLFQRTPDGNYYVRRRIPADLRHVYPPGHTEICRSLKTSERTEAGYRADLEYARIDEEFKAKRKDARTPVCLKTLTDDQLQDLGRYWSCQVLLGDEKRREAGLGDDEFDALGSELMQQRAELARLLARGQSLALLPALSAFLHLCGIQFQPNGPEAQRTSYGFLKAVVRTLDQLLARQAGDLIDATALTPEPRHPLHGIAPARDPTAISWEAVFEAWKAHVVGRPTSTVIAYQTPWTDLARFAARRGMTSPADVTEALMTEFVADMVKRLAAKTLNGRLSKICSIFKVAKGKHLLQVNPAAETLGVKESRVLKRKTRRLPFDEADIQRIFSSDVYTRQARSKGSSREATYWIPLMMFYSGARPEEIAGLALDEIREDPSHGWYFDIVDRPSSSEDDDLFGKSQKKGKDDGRNLKTNASVRRVPIAKELISLGLLEYVAWVRKKYAGAKLLFPTLKKDTHGKFSGAFLKHFGRELRKLGITDPRKVLYSFRHTFKDLLEQAGVDSRYLRRLLGHTTGDGSITDGYGSDLPFDRIVGHFSHVRFPTISMKTWEPGAGFVGHMKCSKTQGECASCAPRSSDMAYEEVGESAV